ncbi:MAG: hypothetical protein IK012_01120 [Fibrobacter sp.]|uniref:hypothetical protein n=1 Tax=Fibrobacter sp. TaxID=35828 RepID=UPI0025BCEA78|nr:hypothetical protein [Fibrobacter sp.]MBR4783841.1 hypothetical protein [Fibrobacter sp.]
MNKFALILVPVLFAAAMLASCSDMSSEKMTGATTEPNDIAREESSSTSETVNGLDTTGVKYSSSTKKLSSAAMMIYSSSSDQGDTLLPPISDVIKTACDSVLAKFDLVTMGTAQDTGSSQPSTSSSHTAYNFQTEREAFYEENGCYVSIYEGEAGVRYLPSRTGAYIEMTSLVYAEEGVVLRLLNSYYTDGSCESDYNAFRTKCEGDLGVFKDYKNGKGCSQNQKLELACAYGADFSSTRSMLQREANLYKRDCEGVTPENQVCGVHCRVIDNVSSCDTICSD